MGLAVLVDQETCLNFLGLRCDVCYRVCPVIDKAITLEPQHNARTGKHALFIPTVHSDACTGCGKCEKSCVLEARRRSRCCRSSSPGRAAAATTGSAGRRRKRPAGSLVAGHARTAGRVVPDEPTDMTPPRTRRRGARRQGLACARQQVAAAAPRARSSASSRCSCWARWPASGSSRAISLQPDARRAAARRSVRAAAIAGRRPLAVPHRADRRGNRARVLSRWSAAAPTARGCARSTWSPMPRPGCAARSACATRARRRQRTRYWLLAGTLPLAAAHRHAGLGVGQSGVDAAPRPDLRRRPRLEHRRSAVFLFDLLVAQRGWCGHLCPVGAFYAIVGKCSPAARVARTARACNDCADCYAVCPEPQVIPPALKREGRGGLAR